MIHPSLLRKISLPFILCTLVQSADLFGQAADDYEDFTPPPIPEEVTPPTPPVPEPEYVSSTSLEIKTDTTLEGLNAASGTISLNPEVLVAGPVALTLNVPTGISYVYGGTVLPHDDAGALGLHLIKTGGGSQELAGVIRETTPEAATRPKLTVDQGTLILSGNIFANPETPWTQDRSVQVLPQAILEIKRDWSAARGNAFNTLSGAAKNIVVEGGTLKFTDAPQYASRGFTVGTGGVTLWTDANFTKPLSEGPNAAEELITGGVDGGGSVTLTGTAGSVVIGGQPTGGSELQEVLGSQGNWQATAKLIKKGSGYWKVAGSNLGGGVEVHDGILSITGPSQTAGPVKLLGGQLNLEHAEAAGTGTVTVTQGRLKINADGYANETIVEGGVVELGGHRSEAKLTLDGGRVTGGENFAGEAIVKQFLEATSQLGSLGGGTLHIASQGALIGQGKVGNVVVETGGGIFLQDGMGPLQMASLQLQADTLIKVALFNLVPANGSDGTLLQVDGTLDLRGLSAAHPLKVKLISLFPEGFEGLGALTEGDLVRFSLIQYENLLVPGDVSLSDLIVFDTTDFNTQSLLQALGGERLAFSINQNAGSQLLELTITSVPEPSHFAAAGFIFIGAIIGKKLRKRRGTTSTRTA